MASSISPISPPSIATSAPYIRGIAQALPVAMAATVAIVFTGSSIIKPEIGKFQISTTGTGDGFIVYETIINTKTGNVIRRNNIRAEHYKTN